MFLEAASYWLWPGISKKFGAYSNLDNPNQQLVIWEYGNLLGLFLVVELGLTCDI